MAGPIRPPHSGPSGPLSCALRALLLPFPMVLAALPIATAALAAYGSSGLAEAIDGHDMAAVRQAVDERPAEVNARDEQGRTPALRALEERQTEIARFLWERSPRDDVWVAAGLGDLTVIGELLRADPGLVSAKDHEGRTPLHKAAECGSVESVAVLLDVGADPGMRDEDGRTPLSLALEKGHADVAELLRQHGATE